MALSAQARTAIARTRAALARPPMVYVPAERCDRPAPQVREPQAPAARVVTPPPRTLTIDEVVQAHVERVPAECGGNISEAARRLGAPRSTVQRRLWRVGR